MKTSQLPAQGAARRRDSDGTVNKQATTVVKARQTTKIAALTFIDMIDDDCSLQCPCARRGPALLLHCEFIPQSPSNASSVQHVMAPLLRQTSFDKPRQYYLTFA